MNRAVAIALTRDQTTVASRILRIILNQNPLCDDSPNFPCRDHPRRLEHLPHCVLQVEHLNGSGRAHTGKDVTYI
jgi:hypothetical protein